LLTEKGGERERPGAAVGPLRFEILEAEMGVARWVLA